MKNKSRFSAYCINFQGKLVYSGLPLRAENLFYEHFQECCYKRGGNVYPISGYHYSIESVSEAGLLPSGKKYKLFI